MSGGTEFLAISDVLFSPSFHLGGAIVVIFSIDWHNSLFLIYVQQVLVRRPAGFPLVPSFIYRSYVVGIVLTLVRHCIVKGQGGCR